MNSSNQIKRYLADVAYTILLKNLFQYAVPKIGRPYYINSPEFSSHTRIMSAMVVYLILLLWNPQISLVKQGTIKHLILVVISSIVPAIWHWLQSLTTLFLFCMPKLTEWSTRKGYLRWEDLASMIVLESWYNFKCWQNNYHKMIAYTQSINIMKDNDSIP